MLEELAARADEYLPAMQSSQACVTATYAKVWVRVLTLLVQKLFADEDETTDHSLFTKYLEEQWNRADTDRSGSLTLKELMHLMKTMNIEVLVYAHVYTCVCACVREND